MNMRDQLIEFVELHEHSRMIVMPDAYSFCPERPHKWLQRACLWVLKTIGCYAEREELKVTRQQFSGHDIIEKIFKQRISIHEVYGKESTRVLIGAQDFEEMMQCATINQHLNFRIYNAYPDEHQIYGLNIEIIPWMRGILVLP